MDTFLKHYVTKPLEDLLCKKMGHLKSRFSLFRLLDLEAYRNFEYQTLGIKFESSLWVTKVGGEEQTRGGISVVSRDDEYAYRRWESERKREDWRRAIKYMSKSLRAPRGYRLRHCEPSESVGLCARSGKLFRRFSVAVKSLVTKK